MTAHRYDPYLWVHLAGLATVPFWLIFCLLGLAVGYPTLPALEITLLVGFGILPMLYMQLQRPFCIFSFVLLALKPVALTEIQRQLLTVFRSQRIRLIAPLVSLTLGGCVLQLYQMAPVARDITPFSHFGRLGGLTIAGAGLLGASLFLHVPMSVLGVLAASKAQLQTAVPYPTEAINQDFYNFGLPLARILPPVSPSHPGKMPNQPHAQDSTETTEMGKNSEVQGSGTLIKPYSPLEESVS